jgi:hypothetical protein
MNLTPAEEAELVEGFTRQFAIATRTKAEHLASCAQEWEKCHKWLWGRGAFERACKALGLDPETVRRAAAKKS